MNPFDYSLCDQTVTLYREGGERWIIPNAYFSGKLSTHAEPYGKSRTKKFLLIIPGDHPISPGDRVYAGIGPEETDWKTFVPANVPALFEVSFAKPCYWEGSLTHWEAGNRKETL